MSLDAAGHLLLAEGHLRKAKGKLKQELKIRAIPCALANLEQAIYSTKSTLKDIHQAKEQP